MHAIRTFLNERRQTANGTNAASKLVGSGLLAAALLTSTAPEVHAGTRGPDVVKKVIQETLFGLLGGGQTRPGYGNGYEQRRYSGERPGYEGGYEQRRYSGERPGYEYSASPGQYRSGSSPIAAIIGLLRTRGESSAPLPTPNRPRLYHGRVVESK